MGLKTRKNEPFAAVTKNSAVQGDNIVFIKGGSTVIGDRWVQFDDLRVDVGALVDTWVSTRATRVFNKKNGILNVLITLNQNQNFDVVPSISLNQTGNGRVTSFENLSGKLPLLLVGLEQDGTNDLSSYKPITSRMIEVYKGYANFTLRGDSGLTGPVGDTGMVGVEGYGGPTGLVGDKGLEGHPGITGPDGLRGETGAAGEEGVPIFRLVTEREAPPIADFVGTPLTGLVPFSVQYTNLSSGTWETIHWDFGDGVSSSEENPLHSYTAEGTYTVTLYLQMMDWDSKEIKYDYILATAYSCLIQDLVDDTEDTWQAVVGTTVENEIQNILGECS